MTRISFIATLAMTTLFTTSALAAGYQYGAGLDTGPDANQEFFADAIEDYSPVGYSNLSLCIDGVESFADWMVASGYEDGVVWTDEHAWSSDFEWYRSDNSQNDAADISYFSGHGSSGAIYFGDTTYPITRYYETRWGDNDVEFVALDACSTLDYRGRYKFATANLDEGVHYILGFATGALDVSTTAEQFGLYLWAYFPVRGAWMFATMNGHPTGHQAAYVRFTSPGCDTYNDSLRSFACDPDSGSSFRTSVWDL